MPIVFFEGFNNSNTDVPKLESNYWTTNNLGTLTLGTTNYARTENSLIIDNRTRTLGTGSNTTVTLSNFSDPLLTNNAFAIGFSIGAVMGAETTDASGVVDPYNAKFLTFFRSGVPVLDLDFVKTTYSGSPSLGIQVRQNGTGVSTHDFRSMDLSSFNSPDSFLDYDPPLLFVDNNIYFECFVDAKSQNKLLMRFSVDGGSQNLIPKNSSNSIYTSISGFTNLTSVRFYSMSWGVADGFSNTARRTLDDLYINGSGNADTCLLGSDTKIHRIIPISGTPISGWISNTNNPVNSIISADGDASYIYADLLTSGVQSLFVFSDVPAGAPTGLILVKSINIARKTAIDTNGKFINVMRSGTTGTVTELGNSYTISGLDYSTFSNFIYNNPVTGSGWKLSEINNMQIGIKTQGTGV
jgi:hypothetical protein